ncbi:MAG: hypothetical protein GKR94_26025 [Gammaproteobacteria bacterium]|nr:hypothetical protein [Gammaproteobacteria bacterium]
MRAYYRKNPQLNRAKALASLKRAEQILLEFPTSGGRFQDLEAVREYLIDGTTSSLLYTVARDTVWIIDIRDQRGFRNAESLRSCTRELRQRYGINLIPAN